MEWNYPTKVIDNRITIPNEWLLPYYFDAFNFFFRIENSVRVFVYVILKNEFKEKWIDCPVQGSKDSPSIINVAKQRISQNESYAYLGYDTICPVLHLTLGDLFSVIISEKCWPVFRKYFSASKDVVKSKFNEISNIRNALAHFRPIKKGDLEFIKQISIQLFTTAESTIVAFMNGSVTVPTNTVDEWYSSLISLSGRHFNVNLSQSKNEEWVQLELMYVVPFLINEGESEKPSPRRTFLQLKVIPVLRSKPNLLRHCISISETENDFYLYGDNVLGSYKALNFRFSRATLKKDFSEIEQDIKTLFDQIEQEAVLLSSDNLAKGQFLEVFQYYSSGDEVKSAKNQVDKLITAISKDTPVEFWGQAKAVSEKYFSDTDRYPWFPVDISAI